MLGIDIGGTGIKGALVDVNTGKLLGERHRILTPDPSTPDAVADVVEQIAQHFDWKGPAGVTFPAVVRQGKVETAANVEKAWIGVDVDSLFSDKLGAPVTALNDADAAGLAEIQFGAGRDHGGTVLVVTLGTGIGSALFAAGQLVPNTELGHLQIRGKDAEHRAAESVRESKDLSWQQWAKRLDEYFAAIEQILWLDRIIVGGGVSKKSEKFLPKVSTRAELVPAELLNDAGIVGAAVAGRQAGQAGG